MKLPGTRLLRATAALALACLASACARAVRVPYSDFSDIKPGKRVHLDVTTVDAHYDVTSFSTSDSTLVITAVSAGTNVYPSSSTKWQVPPTLPYELRFDQITSLRRVQEPHVILSVVGGMVLVTSIIVALYIIGLSQLEGVGG